MLDSYKLQLAQMPPSGLPMSKLVKTYAEFLHKFFQTFCVCVNQKKEPDAVDISQEITSSFLATLLMKQVVFLVLQMAGT